MALEVTMSVEQQTLVHANPKTQAGNAALVDGAVVFEVMSGDVSLMAGPDPMSQWMIAGAIGDSVVRVSADADLGAGLELLEDTVNVHVTGAHAANLDLTADAPVLKTT